MSFINDLAAAKEARSRAPRPSVAENEAAAIAARAAQEQSENGAIAADIEAAGGIDAFRKGQEAAARQWRNATNLSGDYN